MAFLFVISFRKFKFTGGGEDQARSGYKTTKRIVLHNIVLDYHFLGEIIGMSVFAIRQPLDYTHTYIHTYVHYCSYVQAFNQDYNLASYTAYVVCVYFIHE